MSKMQKVKLASEERRPGFEHVFGCFKYFSIVSIDLLFWTGFMPFKIGGRIQMFEFKLISASSSLSLVFC